MDSFAQRLLDWFDAYGRHDLPWQVDRTPYRVWLSEVMLQQTQVATVIPYYQRFVARFPDVNSLAEAPIDEVLGLWSGLGYYSRARNLHSAAQRVVTEFSANMPDDRGALMALPGIGRSTAGAILAIAFGRSEPILDGNVKRVLSRYHGVAGWPGQREVESQLWEYASGHTPTARAADYTQAIMDLGATLCTRRKPRCDDCPQATECVALNQQAVDAYPAPRPRKSLPIRTVRYLLAVRPDGAVLLERRPPTGVWGGLWCLPELVVDDAASPAGYRVVRKEEWPAFRHTFSHFHLDIIPVCLHLEGAGAAAVMEEDERVWYKSDSFSQLGLPAPIRRLLDRLTEMTE